MKYLLVLFLVINSYGVDLKASYSYKEAISQAKKTNKKVLLYLKAGYCRWCVKMEKEVLFNSKVTKFINDNYIFLQLDKDNDTYPKQFNTSIIPTTYLINPTTEEKIHAMYGYVKAPRLIDDLSFYND
ncbi:MAG: hypothetical protein DRG78_16075 [Epsilonproteobacteria bacterium]|nr:MAG: hypothetical protein DRG78_16075 [Campylobacterota bacterium]